MIGPGEGKRSGPWRPLVGLWGRGLGLVGPWGLAAFSQEAGRLTLEKLYHPTQKITYLSAPSSYEWRQDGSLFVNQKGNLTRCSPSGRLTRLCRFEHMTQWLTRAGLKPDLAQSVARWGKWIWSPVEDACIVIVNKNFYLVRFKKKQVQALTVGGQNHHPPLFSPDGKRIAYVKQNDLYCLTISTGQEMRLTKGGSETMLHGLLDWVYEEEIYGRGNSNAFWWAPDSQRLAYLSLDLSGVAVHCLVDERKKQQVMRLRYPKAGEPPPVAQLSVVNVKGDSQVLENPYPRQETLIVQVGWDVKGRLWAAFQDRLQTWLERRLVSTWTPQGNLSSHLISRESSDTWQERLPLPWVLQDGSLVVLSDRSGWRHLYHLDSQGQCMRALTQGEWDVRACHYVDERNNRLYFSATEKSALGLDCYALALKGPFPNGGLTRLSETPGYHAVSFSPCGRAYLDRFGNAETPLRIALCDTQGHTLRLLEDVATSHFQALTKPMSRFQQVRARDGVPLETQLILPPDFSPTRQYPVYHALYGAPDMPSVRNAKPNLWHYFLAQQGYVVWLCDPRSASGKGRTAARSVYKRLGQQEIQDQLDGLAWLQQQGFVDMKRILLEGWSYGGFLAAQAMASSQAWCAGILGAPVTDFRLYDCVYAERYLGFPSQNAAGYLQTDISKKVHAFQGPLLIFHGALDDNVLPQNSLRLVDALQKAGKPHEWVLLPGAKHGVQGEEQTWFRYLKSWEFIQKKGMNR